MSKPKDPRHEVIQVILDTLRDVIFLIGVATIELVIRPWFKSTGGVPLLADLTLTIFTLTFILFQLRRLYKEFDAFVTQIVNSRSGKGFMSMVIKIFNCLQRGRVNL